MHTDNTTRNQAWLELLAPSLSEGVSSSVSFIPSDDFKALSRRNAHKLGTQDQRPCLVGAGYFILIRQNDKGEPTKVDLFVQEDKTRSVFKELKRRLEERELRSILLNVAAQAASA